jgi:hypothetical protein
MEFNTVSSDIVLANSVEDRKCSAGLGRAGGKPFRGVGGFSDVGLGVGEGEGVGKCVGRGAILPCLCCV